MLSAAQEVFAEKGYTDATIDEVAARAEYGKGTLYNYFPGGKQEILLAIIEQFHDELCDLIACTFGTEPDRPIREAVKDFLQQTFDFFLKRTELFLTILREAHRLGLSDDAGPRAFFAQQHARALNALSAPLEKAMRRGELRNMPPRMLAHMILVNINGAQLRACTAANDPEAVIPESAIELAEFMTSLLFDGLAPSAPSA